jgi:O-antigen/teichoic acid export membrane protein
VASGESKAGPFSGNFGGSLIYRGSLALSLRLAGSGLQLLTAWYLARSLGAGGLGAFLLSYGIANLAGRLGRLGHDQALLQFVALHAPAGEWSKIRSASQQGVRIVLVGAAAIALGLLALTPFASSSLFLKPELEGPLRWMVLSVVPYSLVGIYTEMLKALGRIGWSTCLQAVLIPALHLGLLVLLVPQFGVEGAAMAYVAASALVCYLARRLWLTGTQVLDVEADAERTTLLRPALSFLTVYLVPSTVELIFTILLGIWVSTTEVALFGVALRVVAPAQLLIAAVGGAAAPRLAQLQRLDDLPGMASVARASAALVALVCGPVLVFFVLMPEWTMGLFGSSFVGGSAVLAILSAGQMVNAATGPIAMVLTMSRLERMLARLVAISGFGQVVLGVLLIPWLTAEGAAAARVVGIIAFNGGAILVARRHLGCAIYPRL